VLGSRVAHERYFGDRLGHADYTSLQSDVITC